MIRNKRELARRLAAAALRGYNRSGPDSFQSMTSPSAMAATESVLQELNKVMGEIKKSQSPSESSVKKKTTSNGLYG